MRSRLVAGFLLLSVVTGCVVHEGSAPQPWPQQPEIERKAPDVPEEVPPDEPAVT